MLSIVVCAACLAVLLTNRAVGQDVDVGQQLPTTTVRCPVTCVPYWKYRGERGQDHWCCYGSTECCGEQQSPINIDTRNVVYLGTNGSRGCLGMNMYRKCPKTLLLYNNGNTVELLPSFEEKKKTSHLIMFENQPYRLVRIVFHWGRNSSYGSEHTLNYVRLPLEMQMIHIRHGYEKILAKNRKSAYGFVIISVLFTLSHYDNDLLRPLIYHLHHVTWKGQRKCIKPFPLSQLMPEQYGYMYVYDGSLSFPPCYEQVIRIVLHNPVPISEYQLNEFRRLQEETEEYCPGLDCPIVDNYRETACVKQRMVVWKEECSTQFEGWDNKAHVCPVKGATVIP